jgi:transposase
MPADHIPPPARIQPPPPRSDAAARATAYDPIRAAPLRKRSSDRRDSAFFRAVSRPLAHTRGSQARSTRFQTDQRHRRPALLRSRHAKHYCIIAAKRYRMPIFLIYDQGGSAMAYADKIVVRLTLAQRQALRRIVRTGTHPAALLRRAHILLKTDADGPDAWADERIAEALDTSRMTVQRVRQQFVREGLDATLHRKRPTGRQYRKLDGKQEGQLIAIACSPAPEGRSRWTMKLLAERLVELEVVESIDPATVCRTLQKTSLSPGSSSSGSSRRRPVPRL